MSDTRGIYEKFQVRRTDGDPTGKHKQCTYFVLDLDHDEGALPALKAYAKACRKKRPQLYKDLQWMIQLAHGPKGEFFPASLGSAMRLKLERNAMSETCQYQLADGVCGAPIVEDPYSYSGWSHVRKVNDEGDQIDAYHWASPVPYGPQATNMQTIIRRCIACGEFPSDNPKHFLYADAGGHRFECVVDLGKDYLRFGMRTG